MLDETFNFQTFFDDTRVFLSILILFVAWYRLGLLDSFLHYMLTVSMRRMLKLPVKFREVRFTLPGSVFIHEMEIHAPPVEEDGRWDTEIIIKVAYIQVDFPFWTALIFYLITFTELFIIDQIIVKGLQFFVEGRVTAGDHMEFNVSMIGKKPQEMKVDTPVTAEPVTLPTEEASKIEIKKSISVHEEILASTDKKVEIKNNSTSIATATELSNTPVKCDEIILHESPVPGVDKKEEIVKVGFGHRFRASVTRIHQKITKKVEVWKDEAIAFNHTVNENGLINATKSKISDVYKKTKQRIEGTIKDQIAAWHEKLSGPEPTTVPPGFVRLVCGRLVFENVEVHLLRALPIQLRHLEKNPLLVPSLEFYHLGFEGIQRVEKKNDNMHISKDNDQRNEKTGVVEKKFVNKSKDSNVERKSINSENGSKTEELVNNVYKDEIINMKTADNEKLKVIINDENVKKEEIIEVSSRRSSDGGSSSTEEVARDVWRSVDSNENKMIYDLLKEQNIHGERQCSENEGTSNNNKKENNQKVEKTEYLITKLLVLSSLGSVRLNRKISEEERSMTRNIRTVGMGLNQLKYRFNRAMLNALFKGNVGRILLDVVSLVKWNPWKVHSQQAAVIQKTPDDSFLKQENHVEARTESAESEKSWAVSSNGEFVLEEDPRIVSYNPIFFDKDFD